ncbi:MAG: hypothetical protein ACOYBO_07725 [Azonexus sp.]
MNVNSRINQLEKRKRRRHDPVVRVFGEDEAGVLREWGESADPQRAWTRMQIDELVNTRGILVYFRDMKTGDRGNE